MNNHSNGHNGVDPQPGHGKDSKGHQDNGHGNGNGNGNGGGGVSRPGRSHALTK